MGIFDFFGGIVNEAKEITESTKLQMIQYGKPDYVLDQLGRPMGSSVREAARAAGYVQALQVLLKDVDDYRLKLYYEQAYRSAKIKQLTALKATMEERGY